MSLNLGELNTKIEKLERHLRATNDGKMPDLPKTIHDQIEQFLLVAEANPKSKTKAKGPGGQTMKEQDLSLMTIAQGPNSRLAHQAKHYITEKRIADIRQIKSDSDVVSALVQACKHCFQLEPHFDFSENSTGQSRFKFTASVKFHGTLIASSSGQNKAESKKFSAKVALAKVAPNLYEDLYGNEEPPKDESIPGN